MPSVEKTDGGHLYLRELGDIHVGDQLDVDQEMASYLVDERGDFEYVDQADGEDALADALKTASADPAEVADDVSRTLADTIESGECPWCDEYEGENVGQHASSAHPDEWDAYKEADSE